MEKAETIYDFLHLGEYAENLYSCSDLFSDKRLEFYKWQAQKVDADYFYCVNSRLENVNIPFIYVYDERGKQADSFRDLSLINRKIWTVGEIPFVLIIYDYEIKVIDTRSHVDEKTGEAKIFDKIQVNEIELKLKKRILDGLVLEESNSDYVKASPYQILLKHIEDNILKKASKIGCNEALLKQLLVKFILIKYLEEQKDENYNSVFQAEYFKQFSSRGSITNSFCDVLRKGNVFLLLEELNNKFNGGIFKIDHAQEHEIYNSNFTPVADALDGNISPYGQISIWKLYDFNLLPIEFISRLYERFVTSSEDEKQKGTGAFYTPPHLARLLIDELLPFNATINLSDFKILDPSCGSGIFLVLAYKRLITLWMLENNKQKIKGIADIEAIKYLLSNSIFGVDINEDALSITATSLQIELTSHIQPKEIWDSLTYENLVSQGNLSNIGFYKWCKNQVSGYDIIVGNPPFGISDKENEINIASGKDLDFKAERYENLLGKMVNFPQNNPALSILYNLLSTCLKKNGSLFLILPATAAIYNSNSSGKSFLETLLFKWDVKKIYDFSPLRGSLWNGAAVSTIAMLIKQKNINIESNFLEHLIIRNTLVNRQGSIRFQIDKYDVFHLTKSDAILKPYIWKANLLGGGHIHLILDKYSNKQKFLKISNLPKILNKQWIIQDGAKSSKKEGQDIANTNLPFLISKRVKKDYISDDDLDKNPVGKYRLDNENLYLPPNLLIKCNVNQGLPIIYNSDKHFIFDNTFFCVKSFNVHDNQLEKLAKILKKSRKLYKFLITVTSSKTFLQKGGNSLINSGDIKRLPIMVDKNDEVISFDNLDDIETAIIEDTDLMAKSLDNVNGPLFSKVSFQDINAFSLSFTKILNYLYQDRDYEFKSIRQIINKDFVWVSFKHTNKPYSIDNEVNETNQGVLNKMLKDENSNNGLSINRIITYYSEENTISFLKPNRLKYWTRSIGFRDAENVKADMFIKGY
ncbi:HsdM family class I SAM-dependent methyltransferase [Pedobacter sp. N23S346]|uniref:HsdM family class I SAM-dependent methyltransferase n=1 Tax=Pedobacter sp. N23S346 TaxID=3402750 RepID=UPI003ACA597A